MKSAVNIVKIGTSIILKVFINFITNKEVYMITFYEPPYKEVYLNNVVWIPVTTLRIMINMDGVSIFEEANKAVIKYGNLHVFAFNHNEVYLNEEV